jgi:hypothetical protein
MPLKTDAVARILLDMPVLPGDVRISARLIIGAVEKAYEQGYEDGERDALADIPEEPEDEPREFVQNPQTGFLNE